MAGKISFPGIGQIKKVSAGGGAIKKISSGGALLWASTLPRQGLLKSGTQQLANATWEKVTGFRVDPAYPDTDPAAPAGNSLFVSGRASFIAQAFMTTGTSTSLTRGVRITGNGATLAETLTSGTSSSRDTLAVVPDGTDTLLEMYAQVNSTTASNRVLQPDTTTMVYRTGSYYDLLSDLTGLQRNVWAEAPLTPNELAEWPRVPSSGIMLDPGLYHLVWNLYSPGWGTDWAVGARLGTDDSNWAPVLGTTSNSWNTTVQLVNVPSRQYLTPIVRSSSSSYLSLAAGRLNLFISRV